MTTTSQPTQALETPTGPVSGHDTPVLQLVPKRADSETTTIDYRTQPIDYARYERRARRYRACQVHRIVGAIAGTPRRSVQTVARWLGRLR
ncbi:MAG TPA: hypothetical protein DD979_10625 [Gammaproteobacteria bacterium]|nr:hypothetical protein [Gammaproteobacteria bacterium]